MRLVRPAESRAVFIGVGTYSDEELPDLRGVHAGAAALRNALIDPELGGLRTEHCLLLPELASREDVGAALVEAATEATDLLLIYYAGHGLRSWDQHDLVLSVSDTRPKLASFSGIRYNEVRDLMMASPARAKVVILDCCFSGRAIGQTLSAAANEIDGETRIDGVATLTSVPANADAVIMEDEEFPAYTTRLLKVIEEGVPGADKYLTVSELKRQVQRICLSDGLRQPQAHLVDQVDQLGLARNRSFIPIPEAVTLHRIRQLERANRDLVQFAYVASHDLQEPLRKVASFTQLLQKRYSGSLDERADQYIEFAVDGARRMQQLIQDLLTQARMGSTAFSQSDVDLTSTLKSVLDQHSDLVIETHAKVTYDALPHVVGDSSALRQVLDSLISNSLKFRERTRPLHIRVEAKTTSTEWEVSVIDNGIGIDAQYSERVFLQFQRLHARDEYPGSGLGLSLAKQIVERHGGSIWTKPTDGGGATVRFTLARTQADPLSPPSVTSTSPGLQSAPTHTQIGLQSEFPSVPPIDQSVPTSS